MANQKPLIKYYGEKVTTVYQKHSVTDALWDMIYYKCDVIVVIVNKIYINIIGL